MRQWLKSRLERSWAARIAAQIGRSRRVDDLLVLVYHNVVPEDEPAFGERSLHITRRLFAEHLDLITSKCDVVPLALKRPASGRPRVAITFDDAYRGAVTTGVDEVVSRGLAATIFVPPGLLGGQSFWWDEVAEHHGGEQPLSLRERFLNHLTGDAPAIRAAFGGPAGDPPPNARSATAAELDDAAARPGIDLAAHTWSHPNLLRCSDERITEELERSAAWIRDRRPDNPLHLSYPYGHADARVARAAEAAGFVTGWRVSGGWLGSAGNPFLLPRYNVAAGLSGPGLALRLGGIGCG